MSTTSELRGDRRSWLASFAVTVCLVVAMTIARVQVTLADPNFDAHDPRGLLKSDPALLYYLTERVIESHGRVPDDFAADPRIEHPDTFDVPATLPVAQEFVVAWSRLALDRFAPVAALPLHVFCLWVAGAFASATLIGVWLLARELSGDAWLALLAAALAAALPASWRTTGFVLMDEDFSLPFFALHLGLFARAARVRTPTSLGLAALALGAALATWHAASFLFALEAVSVLAWTMWSGRRPFVARGSSVIPIVLVPLVLIAFALGVPFLRASAFFASAPMLIVYALALAALALRVRLAPSAASVSGETNEVGEAPSDADHRERRRVRIAVSVALVATMAGAWLYARVAGSENTYGHVFGLLAAKAEFLGALPADPRALSPDVRLMWQGPFATMTPSTAGTYLGLAWLVVPLAIAVMFAATRARDADPRAAVTCLFLLVAVFAAWMIERVVVLPAMLVPVVAAMLVGGRVGLPAWTSSRNARLAACVLVVGQIACGASWLRDYRNPWYASPRQRQAELATLVRTIPDLVPADAAIACDSMNSSAILAHTRRRVILSPKWESAASRMRVVEFLSSFANESPAAFRDRLVQRFRCRYVLIDRFTLGYLSSYAAGMRDGVPEPGSAAATFLSKDARTLENVPGYRLLYRSPESIWQSDGTPTDFYRLYELVP